MYEDIGIFTCDETMGVDATDLFNYLTGYSTKQDYKKLLIAPVTLRARLEELIEREITHAVAGRRAHLILKANSLVDPRVIRQLYRASQAGVRVELFIRGICCLRPGWPGVSENITVVSTVGRYLEHSRIFYFLNDGAEEVYLGSADLMQRNLSHRVEVVFPVESPEHRRYLCDHALDSYRQDNFKARSMRTDGTYGRVLTGEGVELRGAQDILMRGSRPAAAPGDTTGGGRRGIDAFLRWATRPCPSSGGPARTATSSSMPRARIRCRNAWAPRQSPAAAHGPSRTGPTSTCTASWPLRRDRCPPISTSRLPSGPGRGVRTRGPF
jgi:hypothetical protein